MRKGAAKEARPVSPRIGPKKFMTPTFQASQVRGSPRVQNGTSKVRLSPVAATFSSCFRSDMLSPVHIFVKYGLLLCHFFLTDRKFPHDTICLLVGEEGKHRDSHRVYNRRPRQRSRRCHSRGERSCRSSKGRRSGLTLCFPALLGVPQGLESLFGDLFRCLLLSFWSQVLQARKFVLDRLL